MTYESALPAQAELRIVRTSTTERKKMSTKTTFKRIVLVTVAALGFGMVAAVSPASAATTTTKVTVAAGAATGFVGEVISVPVKVTTVGVPDTTDSFTVNVSLTSKPTLSSATPDTAAAVTALAASAVALDKFRFKHIASPGITGWDSSTVNSAGSVSNAAISFDGNGSVDSLTAKTVANFEFKASTPGTYTFTVTPSAVAGAGSGVTYTAGVITVTVLSVGGKVGDGTIASPYTAFSGVAGALNYVQIKASGTSLTTARATQVVVTGGTFSATSDATNAAILTDKTSVIIAGVTSGEATSATLTIPTPTVGTITVKTYVETGPGIYSTTASGTVTITVNATAQSGAYSYNEAYMATGDNAAATATTDAAAVKTVPTVASTVSSTPVATILVSQYDALEAALPATATKAVIAEITGAGVLGTASGTPSAAYIAVAAASANDQTFYIFPDGRAGVGTVKITVNGVLALTRTVAFTGPVASLKEDAENSPSKTYIGVGETGTISVFSYDAASTLISKTPTVTATSETTTVATVAVSTTAGTVIVTGVAAGKTNITIASGTIKLVVPVEITKVSAKEGGVTLSFDKATYEPGEKMILTVKAVDTNGRPVADGSRALFTSTGLTSNVTFGGASVAINLADVTLSKGVKEYVLYAPSTSGTITVTGTEGAATALTERAAASTAGTTYVAKKPTASAVVVNSAVDAATDAANEAVDAANAATDAALAAAEAADAATTAAQEASDAVAALSESVTKLIAGLQAQIKSLAAVVAKIAKKVKA